MALLTIVRTAESSPKLVTLSDCNYCTQRYKQLFTLLHFCKCELGSVYCKSVVSLAVFRYLSHCLALCSGLPLCIAVFRCL